MRGMQNLNEIDSDRAITEEYERIPDGAGFDRFTWISPTICSPEIGPISIYCRKPEDLGNIVNKMNGLINDQTRVSHRYCDVNIPVATLGQIREEPERFGFSSDISDIIEDSMRLRRGVNDTEPQTGNEPSNIAYIMDYQKTNKFNRSEVYEELFKEYKELGMNVDRFKVRGKDQFRYRRRIKEGVAGGWVSGDFAMNAVEGLRTYLSIKDSKQLEDVNKTVEIAGNYFTKEHLAKTVTSAYTTLLNNGDWKSLKAAKNIANKYLNGEEHKKLNAVVEFQLESKAKELAEGIEHGMGLKPDTAIQVYSKLITTRDRGNVKLALDVARHYLPGLVKTTTDFYNSIWTTRTAEVRCRPSRTRRDAVTQELNISALKKRPKQDYEQTRKIAVPPQIPEAAYEQVTDDMIITGPPPIPASVYQEVTKVSKIPPPPPPDAYRSRVTPPPIPMEAYRARTKRFGSGARRVAA
ncbi:hypothetical protein ACFL3V_05950 [Nanoarchaeota archaeon]